jgi:hypothetical protein
VIFDGSAQGFISQLRRRLPSAVTGKERLVRTYVETQKAAIGFWRVHPEDAFLLKIYLFFNIYSLNYTRYVRKLLSTTF